MLMVTYITTRVSALATEFSITFRNIRRAGGPEKGLIYRAHLMFLTERRPEKGLI